MIGFGLSAQDPWATLGMTGAEGTMISFDSSAQDRREAKRLPYRSGDTGGIRLSSIVPRKPHHDFYMFCKRKHIHGLYLFGFVSVFG